MADTLLAVLSLELCPRTGTGGLVLASEFLVNTPAIAGLIRESRAGQRELLSAMQTGKKYGMQLLDDHLFSLAERQIIAPEVAIERALQPSEWQSRWEAHVRGRRKPDDSGESDGGELSTKPVRPDRPPPGLEGQVELGQPPADFEGRPGPEEP